MVSFPCFAALEMNPDFDCMLGHMCQWFAKFRYVGSIWNFGKQSCWLFVLLSMHLMLVGCLIALMVFCLRPGDCRACGSITSRACRTG